MSDVTDDAVTGTLGREPLLRASAYSIMATIVTAGLGYLYWMVATRLVSAEVVGYAAGATSLATGVALATNLGTSGYLVERLPRLEGTPRWRTVFGEAVGATLLVTAVVAVIAELLVAMNAHGGLDSLLVAIPSALAAVALTFTMLLESTFLSARKMHLSVVLGSVMGITKLASLGLALLLGLRLESLLVGWLISLLVSCAIGGLLIFRRLRFGRLWVTLRSPFLYREMPTLLGHHLTSLGGLMVPFLLPTLVVTRLGGESGGFFYTTWMLGSFFFMISPAISNSLFAEGARDLAQLSRKTRRALALVMLLLPVPVVVAVFAGKWLLLLFGPVYADNGRALLAVLAIAALPDAVSNLGVAVLRTVGRLRASAALNVGMGLISLGGAWVVMPHWGITGAGIAWLAAQTLGMLVSVPILVRVLRQKAVLTPA